MSAIASPVFIARITEVYVDNVCPPHPEAGLELRLFIPGGHEAAEGAMPLEYTLQGETATNYVHFFIKGIGGGISPEELHRLCLLLVMVRDTFFNGLLGFVNLKADR